LEILIALAFVWWLMAAKNKLAFFQEQRKYLLPIVLIFGGLILSILANNNHFSGLGILKGWFLAPFLIFFMIYSYIPKEKIINIYKFYFWSVAAVSAMSLIYVLLGFLTFDGRLQGIFNSPNYLAMYTCPGIIVGAIWLSRMQSAKIKMQNFNAKLKIGIFVFFSVMVVALYFTYSYAAWLAITLSLTAVWWSKVITFKNKKIFWLALFIVLVLSLQVGSAKFHNLSNSRSSFQSRLMIWQSSEKMLESNWLLGIGPANFQEKYLSYQKYFPPYLEWAVPHPHNIFLAFWLYSGLLGLLGFLILLFYFFSDLVKKDNNPLRIIALVVMIYFLLHGLIDTTYFKNDLAIVFWLNFLALKKPMRINE
jgi:O-antigen ligase